VQKLYFEGNIHSYTYADEGASLYDVLNLYNGKHDRIRDQLVGSMKSMEDLEDYIEKTEDVQLGMMVELVKEYGNEIPSLIKELKSKHVEDNDKETAEMVFSTVHRAKGMEYDAVQLVEDFINEPKLEKLKADAALSGEQINGIKWNEEINLLYVAITRTRGWLRIPESLLPKEFPPSPQIQVIKPPKKEEKKAESRTTGTVNRFRKKQVSRENDSNAYSYTEKRLAHKNNYTPWTSDQDEELRELFFRESSLAEMAEHFGRNKGSILSRLKKLGCRPGE
jgi:superfamily I DNA/RNA helicase